MMSHIETSPLAVYPALYDASDDASDRAQAAELRCYKVNSLFLIIGAALALLGEVTEVNTVAAIASAIAFIISLAAYLFSQHRDYKGRWYRARALAESIKTATWRFMMQADPFDSTSTSEDSAKYRKLLTELLKENSSLGEMLAEHANTGEQLPQSTIDIRNGSFADKRQIYLRDRIDDQLNWYLTKARQNKAHAKSFMLWVSLAYGAAIALLLVRIGYPTLNQLPIDLLAVIATILIGWKQLRRFDELASAYALTAHEVGIIRTRFDDVRSAAALSDFVSDAENAFSREHTQWAARRDH